MTTTQTPFTLRGRWPRLVLTAVLIVGLALAGVMLAATPSQADPQLDELRRAIEEQERKRQELEREIQQTEEQLRQYRNEENQMLQQLAAVEADLQRTVNERRLLDQRLNEIVHELALTEAELENAEIELEERTDLMNRRLVATYKMGFVSYLEVLLDAQDFSDFISRLEMLRQIVSTDVQIFRAVEEARDEVAERKAEIEGLHAETSSVRDEVAAKENDIRVQVAAQTEMARQVRQNRQAVEAMLREQERASRQVERLLQDLQVQFARASGEMAFMWPHDGRLTSSYGMRWHPILGGWRLHAGIDIGAPWGAPVRSSESGAVLFAGWMGGYGITVVIDHGRNLSSLYAHNSSLAVQAGSIVERGQVIAYVGTTGNSTGPHIHFEIRERGTPVNPMNYLP